MTDAKLEVEDITVPSGRAVRIVTLARPDQRNPLDQASVAALLATAQQSIDLGVGALVITGKGTAFSAGGDLRGYLQLYDSPLEFQNFLDDFRHLCDLLERGPMVTVAMVNGACVAGGLELALACDLVYLSEEARIGDGHLASGQLPGAGGSQRLSRAIGLLAARELLLTGRLLAADEAERIGLATRVFPAAELRNHTLALLDEVLRHSPQGIAQMKQMIALSQRRHLDDGLTEEVALVRNYVATSHDAQEGLRAFLERRPPEYRD